MHLQDPSAPIFVAGHRGLVGSAVVRRLRAAGYANLLLRTRDELDLRDRAAVDRFFAEARPQFVVLAAARVGGILANAAEPASFLAENLAIALNVIGAAHAAGVGGRGRLIFLGSSCIYPRHAPQPMREEHLLTGALEPTNEAYAVAKIAGLKLAEACHRQHGDDFVSLMPTNLYGPGDNFDLRSSHVLPALVRKFHEAKEAGAREVVIWGTGTPRREFLHVDDLADACVFLMERYDSEDHINVGTGEDLSIRELAEAIREIVYPGAVLTFDTTKPDGMPRKLLDVSRLHALGWRHRIGLKEGIAETYRWFLDHQGSLRATTVART